MTHNDESKTEQEELEETVMDIASKTEEDIIPSYIRKNNEKKFNKIKMCKYYGHHLECW